MFSWILKCQFLGPYPSPQVGPTSDRKASSLVGSMMSPLGLRTVEHNPDTRTTHLVIPTSLYKLHIRKNPVLWLGPIVPCKSKMMTFHLSEDRKCILINSSVHTPLTGLPKSQISCFLEKKSDTAFQCLLSDGNYWRHNLKPKYITSLVGGFSPFEKY